MEIVWLEDFLALSKTLNFSRAAEVRNLTQPAFSRRIQQLERWLGTTLVDRSSSPATLTSEGRDFVRVAGEIVRTLNEERAFYQGQIPSSRRPFVSFSMTHTLAISFYPEWMQAVERELGTIRTQVTCSSTHGCIQGLISGNIDFMLSYVNPAWPIVLDEAQYPSALLGRDQLVPVTAPASPQAPAYCLDDAGSQSIPFLDCGPNTITSKMVDAILQAAKPRPMLETRYRNTIAAALKAMAMQGRGITWLPRQSVAAELAAGSLILAGSEKWSLPMQLRIYRGRKGLNVDKDRIWALCRRTDI